MVQCSVDVLSSVELSEGWLKLVLITGELAELRQAAERTRVQFLDSQQREKVLVRRLAAKEHETQDCVVSS